MRLFGHPFSSYTWKALIALYEKELDFELCVIDGTHPDHGEALRQMWPRGQFPVLDDGGTVRIESSIIIEHLDLAYPETVRLIPTDPAEALDVRFMDRIFDNHVMANMSAIVAEHLPFITPTPDAARIERAKAHLATLYAWLDARLPDQDWACGDTFSMADCAAAPALFYADWVLPIDEDFGTLKAFRARLLARPSVARAVDGGRPFRPFFPLGAPDRD